MKIKKEYIIAAVIIVLSLTYLIVRSDSKVNYKVPRFTEVVKDEITAISMIDENQSVELRKTGDSWLIEPQGYRADSSQISRLLSEASELTVVDLITNREDYERYELDDSKAINIKISTEEGTQREFALGKSSSSAIYSYIRLPEEKGIYSVRGNLKNVFSLSLDTWRDKQVMSFDPESVGALEINNEGNIVTFTKTTVTETPGWSRDGEILENSSEFDNQIKTLSMLKNTGFLEEENDGPAQVTVKVTLPSGVHTLEVFEKLENGYKAKSSYAEGSFMIPVYVGDMILSLTP